jgi:hypothetical protein
VAKRTKVVCLEVLRSLAENAKNVDSYNWAHVQETLLVGLQVRSIPWINLLQFSSKVLVPPIRGKPFRTLSLEDKASNSMLAHHVLHP